MEDTKLDIRELLQGTLFESQAEIIASKIEAGGLDDSRYIDDLPQLGSKLGGQNTNEVLAVIRQQMALVEAGTDELDGDSEPEEPVWLKATDAAVRLAEEHDIDLSLVDKGSGKSGLITKGDVENMIGD
jgi:pyruvate/2-oxoglutarate dehydrogenase complex dihydrolipoamide acyltransferase (E2) component